MADKSINQLTQATDLTDSSLFVIEQNSTAKQANWGMMKNYISPGVAAQYSSSATYDVGDYVIYNGNLYRCTTAITTAETWTAAHWTAAVLGNDVGGLNKALGNGFLGQAVSRGTDINDIKTIGLWYLTGGYGYANYPYNSAYNSWLIVVKYKAIFQQILIPYFFSSTAPALSEQCMRRNYNGSTWSEWKPFEYKNNALIDNLTNSAITIKGVVPNNTDFNDITDQGIWFAPSGGGNVYTNYPYNNDYASWVFVIKVSSLVQQILIPYFISDTASALALPVKRRNYNGSSWSNWKDLGGIDSITNNYEFNTFENSYTINATPSITSDSNNYLASTNDTTDRTADIVTMLSSTGVCHLGPGDFYVKDLVMPNKSAIIGSGSATRLIMIDTSDGCAIQMKDYCLVRDLQIWGSSSAITRPSAVGNRHGILWAGTWAEEETATNQPKEGIVSNVWIKYFTGGGITCYNTGFATYFALEVTNAYIEGCGAGINISYWSEFHKFTNIRTPACLYGCINNGGNNVFVNCDFSTCTHALLMDNSSSQSPNNSHGSMVGCVFNHTNSNTGIGIKVLNCDNGFVFDGCQIFYSQIDIEDSDGVVISNTNFGDVNCGITIVGGGTVLFANNMHQAAPNISITDNNNVHFVNCYIRGTGASVGN